MRRYFAIFVLLCCLLFQACIADMFGGGGGSSVVNQASQNGGTTIGTSNDPDFSGSIEQVPDVNNTQVDSISGPIGIPAPIAKLINPPNALKIRGKLVPKNQITDLPAPGMTEELDTVPTENLDNAAEEVLLPQKPDIGSGQTNLALMTEDESQSMTEDLIVIEGLKDAATPGKVLAFYEPGKLDQILKTVEVLPDGSFKAELPLEYQTKPIHIAYYEQEENAIGDALVAVVHSKDNYQVMIDDESRLINLPVSFFNQFVLYNYVVGDNRYQIRMQNLNGEEPAIFAETDHYLDQLQPVMDSVLVKNQNSENAVSVFGVNPLNMSVESVSSDGQIYRHTPQNGDVIPGNDRMNSGPLEDGGFVRNAAKVLIDMHPSFKFLVAFVKDADPQVPSYFNVISLAPLEEPAVLYGIFGMENYDVNYLKFVDGQNLYLSERRLESGDPEFDPVYKYYLESLSFSRFTDYTADTFVSLNATGENIFGLGGTIRLKLDFPIQQISRSMLYLGSKLSGTGPSVFAIFECQLDDIWQLCRNDAIDEYSVVVQNEGDSREPDLSGGDLFLTWAQKFDDGSSHIMLKHMATGEIFSVTTSDSPLKAKFKYNEKPYFAPSSQILFFLSSNDNINFYPTIINLENHIVAGKYIESSQYCSKEFGICLDEGTDKESVIPGVNDKIVNSPALTERYRSNTTNPEPLTSETIDSLKEEQPAPVDEPVPEPL